MEGQRKGMLNGISFVTVKFAVQYRSKECKPGNLPFARHILKEERENKGGGASTCLNSLSNVRTCFHACTCVYTRYAHDSRFAPFFTHSIMEKFFVPNESPTLHFFDVLYIIIQFLFDYVLFSNAFLMSIKWLWLISVFWFSSFDKVPITHYIIIRPSFNF